MQFELARLARFLDYPRMFLFRTALALILASTLSGCTFAISPLMFLLIKNDAPEYYEAPEINSRPSDISAPAEPVESKIAFDMEYSDFLKA